MWRILRHTCDAVTERESEGEGKGDEENVLLQVFGRAGQIKFVRITGEPTSASRFAFVEFAEHAEALEGLKMNGQMIGDRPVKVNLSKHAIVKVFFLFFWRGATDAYVECVV